jgi:hypothetical protein
MSLLSKSKIIAGLALHLALIATPGVARLLHAPDVALQGVVPPRVSPGLSWAAWWDGSLQADLQTTQESSLGLRGVLVRTDNSLQELLGDTKPGAPVVHGDHGTLFLYEDVRHYTRRSEEVPDLARVRDLADLVARLQTKLEQRGTHFVVIVSPSGTSIYPEDVPARWRLRDPDAIERGAAAANAFRSQLTVRGAPFTDAATVLRARAAGSDAERELLWSRLGRHWAPVGSCAVLREALAPLLPNFPCQTRELDVVNDRHWNRDLLALLNRWERQPSALSILPKTTVIPHCPFRPLIVGTSFSLNLMEWMRGATADVVRLFYYNSTIFEVSPTTTYEVGKVIPHSASWEHYVGDRNLIILEVLETQVNGDYMRSFLEDMMARE